MGKAKQKASPSQDLVELIDGLIKLRILEATQCPPHNPFRLEKDGELLKREIAAAFNRR